MASLLNPGSGTRVLSYGGGVQSTALLALACAGKIRLDAVLYVDLHTAESPATREYVHDYALPRVMRELPHARIAVTTPQRLYEDMLAHPEFTPVPFKTFDSKILKRQCTYRYKIVPFRRALRQIAPQASKKSPIYVLYGISAEEWHRMRTSDVLYIRNEYPLIDLQFTRRHCVDFLQNHGWIIPQRSSCWFCPYRNKKDKFAILERYPHLRALAATLERVINSSRAERGLDALEIITLEGGDIQTCMFGCEF